MSTRLHLVAKDTSHLRSLVESEMQKHGFKCDLNHIDVSQLASFSDVFRDSNFNGDISKWDMRNAVDVTRMFQCSCFNGDISNWNTAKIENAGSLFEWSHFKSDISKWDTQNLRIATRMFRQTNFDGDLSQWKTSCLITAHDMFKDATEFTGNLSNWRFDDARFDGMAHTGFKGVLPRPMDSSTAARQYAKLFNNESGFDCYLSERPFNAAHAAVLCTSAICPTWFPKEDYAWFKEISGVAHSIGMDMRDLSTHVLAQYPTRHSRTVYTESWHMGEDALSDEGAIHD